MQVCVRAETMGVAVPRPRTVLTELHNQNLYWRAMLRRLPLSDIQKEKRLSFAQVYHQKPLSWFRLCALHQDDGKVEYFSTADSRAQARSMRKTHGYRTPADGIQKERCSPSPRKHRNNVTAVKVFAMLGRGEVHIWEYIEPTNSAWPKGSKKANSGPVYAGYVNDYVGLKLRAATLNTLKTLKTLKTLTKISTFAVLKSRRNDIYVAYISVDWQHLR